MCRLLVLAALLVAFPASAVVTMDSVYVGDSGNAPDTATNCTSANCGSVDHAYYISKYEVTNAQYAEFLNAVDAGGTNTLGLYAEAMGAKISFVAGNAAGSKYIVKSGFANKPVTYVSFYDALRFANWLHNGRGPASTETGAYTLLGGTPTPSNGTTVTRNPGAITFLTSENEWYKAAYYDPTSASYFDYPTGTDSQTGCVSPSQDTGNSANCGSANGGSFTDAGAYGLSESPYGTFDQGGNVWEWNEQSLGGTARSVRGGAAGIPDPGWLAASFQFHWSAAFMDQLIGFRVASLFAPLEWVYVGDPGNPAYFASACHPEPDSWEPCGSVAYPYYISKFEVTNAQYAEFLNAVADVDPNGLYNAFMGSSAVGGITRSGSSGSYSYAVKSGQGNNPVVLVSWYDALRFANWLHNGKPTGAPGPLTTEDGAYTITADGVSHYSIIRNPSARFSLPSDNEWFKAAYYDARAFSYYLYPTGSSIEPISEPPPGGPNSANFDFALTGPNPLTDVGAYRHSASPYGTYDQAGNAYEWTDTWQVSGPGLPPVLIVRGGSWLEGSGNFYASNSAGTEWHNEDGSKGFRVVTSVPGLLCHDGLDNDGDGLIDLADPGCAGVTDLDERSPTLPCDDGSDNDGDGKADYRALGGGDPGCYNAVSTRENPQCQDGRNNDNAAGIDFDGGASLDLDRNGYVDAAFNPATPRVVAADPQCFGTPWRDKESIGGCGLGFEIVFLAPLLARLARRRTG